MPVPQLIPARKGAAARIKKGQVLKVVNTHGSQVVDFWAFNEADLGECMSMEHSRASLVKIIPAVGDVLITNKRRPILTVIEDTSPGIHDTLIAACDDYRYGLLGCTGYHDNCTDNLHAALRQIGLKSPETPSPLNQLGVKGVGEAGTIPAAAALISAIEDALSPFGVRIGQVPLPPMKIVEMIRRGRPQ